MMPEAKHIHLSVVLSSILVLSGCSALNFLNVDAVDDNVDYTKTAKSVRALAIPPGLSSPDYNGTYAAANTGASASSVSAVNQAPIRETQASRIVTDATPVVAQQDQRDQSVSMAGVGSAPATSSDPNSSLGAALLAQSETGNRTQIAQTQARVQKPAPVKQTRVANTRNSAMPQVAMIRLKGGEPALAVNAPHAAAWKVLAPILPKVGFAISKQQPNQGIFTTTYNGQSGNGLNNGQTYLILLAENASQQSFIGVADANGKPANEATAQRTLGLLRTEFEK